MPFGVGHVPVGFEVHPPKASHPNGPLHQKQFQEKLLSFVSRTRRKCVFDQHTFQVESLQRKRLFKKAFLEKKGRGIEDGKDERFWEDFEEQKRESEQLQRIESSLLANEPK